MESANPGMNERLAEATVDERAQLVPLAAGPSKSLAILQSLAGVLPRVVSIVVSISVFSIMEERVHAGARHGGTQPT